MPSADAPQPIGPDRDELTVLTSREGIAASIGHDLVLRFTRWSGTVDPAGRSVEVTVDLRSLVVVRGTGGAVPLRPADRREIVRTALRLLDVERHPTARFTAAGVVAETGDSGVIEGTLTIRGRDAPLRLDVTRGTRGWHASGAVRQSTFGITPYRAALGALRVADVVRIAVELRPDGVDPGSPTAGD